MADDFSGFDPNQFDVPQDPNQFNVPQDPNQYNVPQDPNQYNVPQDPNQFNVPTGNTSSPGNLDLGSIAKMLGFSNVGGLMSALAPFLGGALAYNATNKATGQMQQGIQNSNEAITKILGGTSPYAPYTAAGTTALGNLGNIGYKPMAGNYQPLGAGRAMTLGQMARK